MIDLSEKGIRQHCPNCDRGKGFFDYPLYETTNFFIACDNFPLATGHILIIPKKHLSCVGAYPKELYEEFLNIYTRIKLFVKQQFGSVSTFEHGTFGQSVFHSHVHILPFTGAPTDIIPEGSSHLRGITDTSKLSQALKNEGGYLYFSIGDQDWLVDPALTELRFFRNRFASTFGNPALADWRNILQDERLMNNARMMNSKTALLWSTTQEK